MEPTALATLLGLGTGIVLGLAARLGQFCTFGAIESAYLGNDQRRIRLWGLVLGTAIVTIYGLDFLGQFNISDTSYHRINWNPIGSIIGGLLFGYGMGLAGNCGFGALAKLAGGDLRSLVILIVKTGLYRLPHDGTYQVARLKGDPQETNGHTYPENYDPERIPNRQDYPLPGHGKNS